MMWQTERDETKDCEVDVIPTDMVDGAMIERGPREYRCW